MTSTTAAGRVAGRDPRAGGPGLPLPLELIGLVGRAVVAVPAYMGGLALLLMASAASLVRFRRRCSQAAPFWATMKGELGWLLGVGGPLVALVHVGMGSSLSLQAYFGSTFVDGTGAVVGVGLLRNMATQMTGMTMAGLLALRFIPGLVGVRRRAGEIEPEDRGRFMGAVAAPRLAAAALATMLLSFWGFLVGSFVGWKSAGTMMGLSTNMYFLFFFRMIWFRDVIGLIVKGLAFGLAGATVCCFEGLRAGDAARDGIGMSAADAGTKADDRGPDASEALSGRLVRAACLSMVSMLILNMTWFLMVYHAVPVFGPSLLQPPSP
ncbi:hypothetical protein OJF2_53440 [Aquisphaera giovannonii]|uniref:Uncharacterized protein n=1 Tax=Aquisphaera giovannonii TaxID=406548 RepID=A0A5B9W966_9BACT|nr:ABC transporter permease [Aquisphaera giovannonii]QEH36759.1 hypothetical protein OJF2_53440 [Aquisphaera giovannonii]